MEQVLIQWEGKLTSDDSWEDKELIRKQYTWFNLEDKVCFHGGGNVMPGNTADSMRDVEESLKVRPMSKRERRSVRWEDFVYT